uniref:Uncharacterized protein n=1 Tax=viral metagenome TaxID=1070528 RepID=A0A6C0BNS3_9ZZZZ
MFKYIRVAWSYLKARLLGSRSFTRLNRRVITGIIKYNGEDRTIHIPLSMRDSIEGLSVEGVRYTSNEVIIESLNMIPGMLPLCPPSYLGYESYKIGESMYNDDEYHALRAAKLRQ